MKRAVLVIDVQRLLVEGPFAAHDSDGTIERINGVTDRARAAGVPVILVQHEADTGPMQRGMPTWSFAPTLHTAKSDTVLPKTTPDSFLRTELDSLLKAQGVQELVICGLQTNYCVDTTTRRALGLGYEVVLVQDGHSTCDGPELTAAQIIAHHNHTLASISSYGPRVALQLAQDVQF